MLINRTKDHKPFALRKLIPEAQGDKSPMLVCAIIAAHILFVMIFPNAMRDLKIGSYALVGVLMIFYAARNSSDIAKYMAAPFLLIHGAGILHGYSQVGSEFVPYVAIAYLVGPIYWFYVIKSSLFIFLADRLRMLFLLGYLLVAVEIVTFSVFYDAIPWGIKELFISDANKSYADGVSIVRLHATGSLIFLFPFMLVSLERTRYLYPLLAALGILATVLSGRTGVVVGVIGAVGICSVLQQRYSAIYAIAGGILLIFLINSLNLIDNDLKWANIAEDHISKIISRGGDERPEQRLELISEFLEAPIFGKGHGMMTEVLRDSQKPWRYELLYEATLFRVGIVGLLVTILPIGWAMMTLFYHVRSHPGDTLGSGIFAGMISTLIASGTNPYFEAVDFQWMIMLPIAYACYVYADRNFYSTSQVVRKVYSRRR